MYAIAGVSGHTGSVVADTLLAAGKRVRVIVRSADKGAAWRAKGAEVAVASLEDRAALAAALRGTHGAYLLLPPGGFDQTQIPAERARLTSAIIGAVADARPAHVVLLSSIGAQHADGTGPIKYLNPLEDGLRATGVPFTALRAGFFMENWGEPARGAIASGSLHYALSVTVPQVATSDIGRTAAKLLVEGAPAQPRIVNIAGPVDLDLAGTAAALSKAAGKPITAVTIPPAAMIDALVGVGASRELAELYGEMMTATAAGKLTWQGDVVRGQVTLEQRLGELLA